MDPPVGQLGAATSIGVAPDDAASAGTVVPEELGCDAEVFNALEKSYVTTLVHN